jgi:hypothetical protein
MAHAIKHDNYVATASGLDVLAGAWLVISPFVLAFSSMNGARVNNIALGIVIGLISLFRVFNPRVGSGLSWLNALFGIWVVVSPWVVGFSRTQTAMVNNVVTGAVVVVLAVWSALASDTAEDDVSRTRTP